MNSHEPKQNYTLESGLAELRSEYRDQPPPRVEGALRARFRARYRQHRLRPWALAVAAAIALLLFLRPAAKRNLSPPVLGVHAPALPETRPPEHVAQVRQAAAAPQHRVHRRAYAAPALAARQPAEFLAIPYSEPLSPNEQVDVYRVRMPRVTLAGFGLPIGPGTLDSAVTADVAVGSDGVARAIRFVR